MTQIKFIKVLSQNDIGLTGAHQAGIVIPKGNVELLAFLPPLDPASLNPSQWIECETSDGSRLRLRFVYYNNRLHVPHGTRNEYRLTRLTKFLRETCAKKGDSFEISRDRGKAYYRIRIVSKDQMEPAQDESGPVRIKLTTAWRRMH